MSLAPVTIRRLTKELTQLSRSPPDGIRVVTNEEDLLDVQGWVQGPPGTPYQGGYFLVRFEFGPEFPSGPPKCTFATKIFHPNVSRTGEICVSTLKKDWKKEYGVGHILLTIKCLLIAPNPDSALDPEAGRLLQEAYADYSKTAKLWTGVHASRRPAEFDDAAVASGSGHGLVAGTVPGAGPGMVQASEGEPKGAQLGRGGSQEELKRAHQQVQNESLQSIANANANATGTQTQPLQQSITNSQSTCTISAATVQDGKLEKPIISHSISGTALDISAGAGVAGTAAKKAAMGAPGAVKKPTAPKRGLKRL